jgi:hypothetical protein
MLIKEMRFINCANLYSNKIQWGSLLLPSLIGPDCDRYFEEHRVPACPNKARRLDKDGRLIRQTNMGTVPRSP